MKRWYIWFLVLCVPQMGWGQTDLTGVWRGHFRSGGRLADLYQVDDRYRFEVQLEQISKQVKGVTYSYHSTDFYAKAAAKGTANPTNGKLVLQELRIIEVRKASNTFVCAMTCFLTYTKSGNEEFLEGTYTAMNVNDSSFCGKGSVFLRRVVESDFYKEPFIVKREKEIAARKQAMAQKNIPSSKPGATTSKPAPTANKSAESKPKTNIPPVASAPAAKLKDPSQSNSNTPISANPNSNPTSKNGANQDPKPSVAPAIESSSKPITIKKPAAQNIPTVLSSRSNELIKTFTFNTRQVSIQLYDNGTIDKDTVSVYLDNKLVVSKKMLTTQPISFSFEMDDDDQPHELVMVAENLGEIPPNTSLMVVKAGSQQFEVRITSTEQKNAMVIFRYQKKD